VYLIAGKPFEEDSEHQAIASKVADGRLYAVRPVPVRMCLAASSPHAGDMNFGRKGALTATVAEVG